MQNDFKPIGARTLIKPHEGDTVSKEGLILSNANNDKMPVKGLVLKAGDQSVFKKGQTLYFRRYAVDILKYNEGGEQVELYVLEDEDIIGISVDNVGEIVA